MDSLQDKLLKRISNDYHYGLNPGYNKEGMKMDISDMRNATLEEVAEAIKSLKKLKSDD